MILWTLLVATGMGAEDYPFSSVENVPERKLIGVDGNGQPRIADKDKPQVARLAADAHTPKQLRSYAIWGLAISGYSPESATGLAQAIEDRSLSDTERGDAAMGLSNFSTQLPIKSKEVLRGRLRAMVTAEAEAVPDGILRTLIAWGDGPWIAEHFGGRMAGHPMEIDVLETLKPDQATGRLLELYRVSERQSVRERASYNRRDDIGRALLTLHDKRGIDILDSLLDIAAAPEDGGAPNPQYCHNVFVAILKTIGRDFGYQHVNYDPSLDEAIKRFREWWLENRYEFAFPKPSPDPDTTDTSKQR